MACIVENVLAASWLSFSVIENLLRENSRISGNFVFPFLNIKNSSIRKYMFEALIHIRDVQF